ncbi:enoyl-CoA hydratase/isomerase family protein [Halegenticoccus soli]|uniref:enoyl-CoA hydratase/isomerase family protein n=1 Tax=Halegenticoccus soli TaxID=1985678 RepID=UPI000C6CA6D3|nr:enoyl-CoA hydratase-related protein [Halegenticoccus soli]
MTARRERYHEHVRLCYEAENESRVAWLTMERGDKPINAFSPSMVDAMTEAVDAVSGTVRGLVLTGEEEFSVGANLRSFWETPREMRPAAIDSMAAASNRFIRALHAFEGPVLAAVGGTAAGGGLGFALACDLVAMHEDAVLDTAYARIGLAPDNATPYFLAQALGPYRARELLFAPRPIGAEEARNLGLVNVVYDGTPEEFRAKVSEYATTVTAGPTKVHAQTKQLVDTALLGDLDQHLERERDTIKRTSASETFDEGLNAFFEDRTPEWD